MGCGNSSGKTNSFILEDYHQPILLDLVPIPSIKNHDILNKLEEAQNLLKDLERFRTILFDEKDDLAYWTGACCYNEEISFENCLNSFLWFLSKNSKGNISFYQIQFNINNEPYFTIQTKTNKDKDTSNKINNYIKNFISIKEEFPLKMKRYSELCKEITDNEANYINELFKEENECEKIDFQNDIAIIKRPMTTMVYDKLNEEFEKDNQYLNEDINLCGADFVDSINAIGKAAQQQNLMNQYDVAYFQFKKANPETKETANSLKNKLEKRMKKKDILKVKSISSPTKIM